MTTRLNPAPVCRLRFSLALLVGAVAVNTSIGLAAGRLGDLTGPWQLFVDDHLIAARDANVTRVYHSFEKYPGNPIMVADKPWENNVVVCNTVLPTEDGTGYRMWYYCWSHKTDSKRSHACYAVSKDGIHWEKPDLGLLKWEMQPELSTNFIEASGDIMHMPQEPDPARRYLCAGGHYHFSSSPDGIHWERLSKEDFVKGGDVGTFMCDPFGERFRGYVKVNAEVSGLRRRAVGYSESTGYDNWPKLRLIMAPDDLDDFWVEPGSIHRTHFYGCPMIPYESMYIGLLWIFRADDEDGYFLGPVFNELVTSRDAVHWLRSEPDAGPKTGAGARTAGRPRLLDVGPAGTWESGMVYASCIVRDGDRLRLYYTAASNLHDSPPFHGEVGLAFLRKDGFASLDADNKPGTLRTRRLTGLTGRLHLNYRAWGGSVRVEVLDDQDKVVPGYAADDCRPLQRDEVDAVVAWRDRAELPSTGGALRLRFLLDKASLFSFAAGDGVRALDEPAGPELTVLYTFEGTKGRQIADKLTADGAQDGRVLGRGKIETDPKNVAFGAQSFMMASPWRPLQRIELPGTRQLGTRFTLAAMVRSDDNKPARLFSACGGQKPVNTSELVFDFDPQGRPPAGLRLIAKGIAVQSGPATFADGKFHHLAVTYDDGHVAFYLDGKPLGEEWLPGGAGVSLARDLLVGEDAELGSNEQLTGYVDDVLVAGRVLTADQIKQCALQGAESVLQSTATSRAP